MNDVNTQQKSLSSHITDMPRIQLGNLFETFEQDSSNFLSIIVEFLLIDCLNNSKTYLCLHVPSGKGVEPRMLGN